MIVNAIIEIPMGTRNKYEIDKNTGRISLDRVLASSVVYPAEYGFISETLAEDGDALDILVLSTSPTVPGCTVSARVLGYLSMCDNRDKDDKIIAVVDKDISFDHLKSINDLTDATKDEIKEFFKTYKNLQNIKVKIGDFYDKEEAQKLIDNAEKKYKL